MFSFAKAYQALTSAVAFGGGYGVVDLAIEAARATPARKAPSLNEILAENPNCIRLPAQPRSSRRRERSRQRAEEWGLAA